MMGDNIEVRHNRNPRATEVWSGDRSGLSLSLTRGGIEVSGWYDGFVGISSIFMTWDEFDKLRADAMKPHAEAIKPV